MVVKFRIVACGIQHGLIINQSLKLHILMGIIDSFGLFNLLKEGCSFRQRWIFWERENLKSGILPEKKLNIYVETTDSYVDGEYLLSGLYEYIGVHVYTTTQNARASVRKYKKLPVQPE